MLPTSDRTALSTFDRVARDLTHQPFPELASAIHACSNSILKEWRDRSLTAMPHLDVLTLVQFENTIAIILSAAADALESADPQQLRGVLEHGPQHGIDRFVQTYSLLDLFEEVRILRGVVIVEIAAQMARALDVSEAATFHAIFDIIVQQGVMALVAKQNELVRQTEATTREINEKLKVAAAHQHELTELAQNAEVALRDSEEFSRTVLESSPDCVKVLDTDGRLLRMNTSGMCLLEIDDLSAFCGKEWATLWPAESRENIVSGIAAAKMGRTYRFQGACPTAKGTPKWWDVMVAPVRDGEGRVIRIVSVSRDITERMAAEQALRESEERYRMLFDLGPVAVYSCEVSGVIRNFNRRAAELWGRAPAEGDTDERFCGSFKMFRPDGTFMPHDRCPMAEVLSGVLPFVHDGEVHIERPDGSRVVVIVSIRPLKNQNGKITGAINCFYDITERQLAEEQLRQAKQTAEDANRAKDKFLAVLSHELRTPLTPVLMTVAAMELNPDLPLTLRDEVRMIRRNVEMESNLIDDLLDLSRIATGKLRLNFDRIGISDLLRQSCDTCRPQIREKGIHLHWAVVEDAGEVVGDPGRLQQVFWNLLNNAAKFTPEGGHIYISAERTNDGQVRVTVRDTGMGIPAEILPRIFDAFEQGEVRITRQFGGMGLGLAICKALVEQHRGTICATTDGPGKGSTFVVELPALSRDESAHPESLPAPATAAAIGPLQLLIVEDHADTAVVLAKMLMARGHRVTTASSAAEALALSAKERFDIIISDLGLPDMTGFELMKRIKETHGTRGIAMSGYGMEDDIKKGEQAGFDDHLIKPVRFAQLEQSIRRVAAK